MLAGQPAGSEGARGEFKHAYQHEEEEGEGEEEMKRRSHSVSGGCRLKPWRGNVSHASLIGRAPV